MYVIKALWDGLLSVSFGTMPRINGFIPFSADVVPDLKLSSGQRIRTDASGLESESNCKLVHGGFMKSSMMRIRQARGASIPTFRLFISN